METTPAGRGMTRRDMLALGALGFVLGMPDTTQAAPAGQLSWGVPISLAPTWLDPRSDLGMLNRWNEMPLSSRFGTWSTRSPAR